MEGLRKINLLYRLGCLFDGDFDGEKVAFNRKRHLWNVAVSSVMYLSVVSYLLVAITGDEVLKNHLVYISLSVGFGDGIFILGNTV